MAGPLYHEDPVQSEPHTGSFLISRHIFFSKLSHYLFFFMCIFWHSILTTILSDGFICLFFYIALGFVTVNMEKYLDTSLEKY